MEMKFGDRLKMCRQGLGVKQVELAKVGEVSQAAIAQAEQNKYKPTSTVKQKFAYFLNVNLYWLETGELSPFVNQKGIIKLNPFTESDHEGVAVQLLNLLDPMTSIFIEDKFKKVLIFKKASDCYIFFYLSLPFNLKSMYEKLARYKSKFLGTAITNISLSEIESISNLTKLFDEQIEYFKKDKGFWIERENVRVKVFNSENDFSCGFDFVTGRFFEIGCSSNQLADLILVLKKLEGKTIAEGRYWQIMSNDEKKAYTIRINGVFISVTKQELLDFTELVNELSNRDDVIKAMEREKYRDIF